MSLIGGGWRNFSWLDMGFLHELCKEVTFCPKMSIPSLWCGCSISSEMPWTWNVLHQITSVSGLYQYLSKMSNGPPSCLIIRSLNTMPTHQWNLRQIFVNAVILSIIECAETRLLPDLRTPLSLRGRYQSLHPDHIELAESVAFCNWM